MSKLKIKTKERRFETARDLYGIFFEDINRAGDGGLYPEMLRNRSFEDSVLPEGYIQQEDGIHVKTVSGFVSLNKPHSRLTESGVELRLREMGKKLGVEKVHPHKFRRKDYGHQSN